MKGYHQRFVESVFVNQKRYIDIEGHQSTGPVNESNLNSDDFINLHSINNNNSYEKRWHSPYDQILSGNDNFDTSLLNTEAANYSGGCNFYFILKLEKGVSLDLININVYQPTGDVIGNTFLMSDFRIYQSNDPSDPIPNNSTMPQSGESKRIGLNVLPVDIDVWESWWEIRQTIYDNAPTVISPWNGDEVRDSRWIDMVHRNFLMTTPKEYVEELAGIIESEENPFQIYPVHTLDDLPSSGFDPFNDSTIQLPADETEKRVAAIKEI